MREFHQTQDEQPVCPGRNDDALSGNSTVVFDGAKPFTTVVLDSC